MILNEDNLIRNGRILIADDDLFYRRLLTNFLMGERFSVTAVSGTVEAGTWIFDRIEKQKDQSIKR